MSMDVLVAVNDRLERIEALLSQLARDVEMVRHEQQRQGKHLAIQLADTQPPEAAE